MNSNTFFEKHFPIKMKYKFQVLIYYLSWHCFYPIRERVDHKLHFWRTYILEIAHEIIVTQILRQINLLLFPNIQPLPFPALVPFGF